ncbi:MULTISPECIES: Rap1a/Tai family immunity protein [unclassified Duganella]|uniref:Rap1a/Tai family immunity protein n=1 Tax=unclassified Duganella TaxID=2636909 RepID=UPI0011C0CDF8|nr:MULTISPECIES: Rap1a/Tai family immunity protein [unclassified Duganella]
MGNLFAIVGAVAMLSQQPAAAAESWKPVPRMSGQEFVQRFFNGKDIPLGQQTTKMMVERELALGYVAGVADAAQGTQWCDKGLVKSVEIDAELAHALRKLPQDTLQQNAGKLIIEQLKKRFPCD